MNKKFIIIGVFAILVSVGLSGCSEQTENNDNVQDNGVKANPLEGTWVGEKESIFGTSSITITELTFTANSVYMTFHYGGTAPMTLSGSYETQGTKLLLTIQTVHSYSFSYSVSDNRLSLDNSVFIKQ